MGMYIPDALRRKIYKLTAAPRVMSFQDENQMPGSLLGICYLQPRRAVATILDTSGIFWPFLKTNNVTGW